MWQGQLNLMNNGSSGLGPKFLAHSGLPKRQGLHNSCRSHAAFRTRTKGQLAVALPLTDEQQELDDTTRRLCVGNSPEAKGTAADNVQAQIREEHAYRHPRRRPHYVLRLHCLQAHSSLCDDSIIGKKKLKISHRQVNGLG